MPKRRRAGHTVLLEPIGVEAVALPDSAATRRRGVALSATLGAVPTTRPRHAVTETDEIAEILDEAARRWSGVPRAKLIPLVMLDWADGGRSPSSRAQARDDLIGSLPGSSGLYGRAEDWPP